MILKEKKMQIYIYKSYEIYNLKRSDSIKRSYDLIKNHILLDLLRYIRYFIKHILTSKTSCKTNIYIQDIVCDRYLHIYYKINICIQNVMQVINLQDNIL